MSHGDKGGRATAQRPGRFSRGEWLEATGGVLEGIVIPELATFAGAKRAQLAVLAQAAVTAAIQNQSRDVTRVASMRPQTFGRAQTQARLRALSRPAVPWDAAVQVKGGPRLSRVTVLGGTGHAHLKGP
ncbi:hypothetical protein LILAB_06170 [Corallococcus macrosporus]|uniref:Uncharacterized protein n=1 Tax=Myxococcus fulvus (strain ATCC BAA-855 / HW-1) TaxID=483219 RepID=F8C7F5_MYXFH|nr:hypothetical protein LILAB_06170 [Corallococcus macrosporus]